MESLARQLAPWPQALGLPTPTSSLWGLRVSKTLDPQAAVALV